MSPEQLNVLLGPLNTRFVKRDPGGHSYVEQAVIRAQLIRILGFGGWSLKQLHPPRLLFEQFEGVTVGRDNPKPGVRVGYQCSVAIVVHDSPRPGHHAEYQGVATGVATMGVNAIGDAHDSALKGADSGALKRAAINLGDQFGLGLYNDGRTDAFIYKVWNGEEFVLFHLPDRDPNPADTADDEHQHLEERLDVSGDE